MVKCGERQLEGGWGVCEISVGLPMNNGTMEAVEYICVNMWCMLDWIMLDWTISSPHSGNNIALTEIGYWGFALPGNELGLLWWDFDALTTWLQIRNSSSNSTESQMPYLTHEMSPYLRFRLPPSSVISANSLLPSSPSSQRWTCFTTNDRTTRCHPRLTPILNGYILPPRPSTLHLEQ